MFLKAFVAFQSMKASFRSRFEDENGAVATEYVENAAPAAQHAIHLGVHPPPCPVRVQISGSARRVESGNLLIGPGKSVSPAL